LGTDPYEETGTVNAVLQPPQVALRRKVGEIVLEYHVPRATDVWIALHNMLGQTVAVLAQGHHSPGKYSLRIDSRQRRSQVLLLRMSADGYVVNEKLMVLE
jgi:hypothetical protein